MFSTPTAHSRMVMRLEGFIAFMLLIIYWSKFTFIRVLCALIQPCTFPKTSSHKWNYWLAANEVVNLICFSSGFLHYSHVLTLSVKVQKNSPISLCIECWETNSTMMSNCFSGKTTGFLHRLKNWKLVLRVYWSDVFSITPGFSRNLY